MGTSPPDLLAMLRTLACLPLFALALAPTLIAQNPVTLLDIAPGSAPSFPSNLSSDFGLQLFFSADDGLTGQELWKVDEQGNVVQVADLVPGPGGSGPDHFVELFESGFSRTLFVADGDLWSTNGFAGGTQKLHDFTSGTWPRQFVTTDGKVFFLADDGVSGLELWVSNGTVAGTQMVIDLNPGPDDGFPVMTFGDPRLLFAWRGQVIFRGDDGVSGAEPWISDGTEVGTVQLGDVNPGAASSLPHHFTPFNDVVVFSADDGVVGSELWTTAGTPATTALHEDILPGPAGSLPNDFVVGDGLLWFDAQSDPLNDGLMTTDLGLGGSTVVKTFGSSLGRLTWSAGKLFFAHANDLWVSDGSSPGTFELPLTAPNFMVPAGNGVYSYGYMPASGVEVYFSDGTAAGTFVAADLEPGPSNSNPFELTLSGGALYFSASSGSSGRELWVMETPFAHTQPIGARCGPSWSTMAVDDPVIGTTVTIAGDSAPPLSFGLIYVEIPFPFPLRLPLSDNCGIAGWPIASFPVGITTEKWALNVGIPNDLSLVGSRATLQAFFSFGTPLTRSSTNGVALTLGL